MRPISFRRVFFRGNRCTSHSGEGGDGGCRWECIALHRWPSNCTQKAAMSADLTVDIRLNLQDCSWSWEIRHARTNTLVESGAGRHDYPSADDAYYAGCARLDALTAGDVDEAA